VQGSDEVGRAISRILEKASSRTPESDSGLRSSGP
jgi:hypothetical protein